MAPQIGNLSVYILTFNAARTFIDVDAFASQLLNGLPSSTLPDLFVLSLQELAPLSLSFLGGASLIPYFKRYSQAVHKAAGRNVYSTVAVRNLGMTGMMVFARDKESVKDLETAGVGVGVREMGDKGAVGVRLRYVKDGESTEVTFVAAHLRAMEDAVEGRNADWEAIVRRLVFSSEAAGGQSVGDGELQPLLSLSARDASLYKSTSHLFVAGDLNYRTSSLKPAPEDYHKTFPQPQDDEGDARHWRELFKSDQLNQEKCAGRTLHGLKEAEIDFPPTYKYDVSKGKGQEFLTPDEDVTKWHWAAHRWPSWCDRILYLENPSWARGKGKITPLKYVALPSLPSSDHRPVALSLTIPVGTIPSPSDEDSESQDPRITPPYRVDIDWKKRNDFARNVESLAGYVLYLTTTWEGGVVALACVAGVFGAAFALKSMVISEQYRQRVLE